MRRVYLNFTFIVFALLISVYGISIFYSRTALGAKFSGTAKQGQSKINITADSLRVNNKTGIAVFTGNVVAIKGKLKILSNVLNVYYTKKNKIKNLVAVGSVHIIKGKDNITGGKAVYYDKAKIAVITEKPVAYEGKNKIIGKKIVIDFKTNISTVYGSPKKRVHATVYSNKSLSAKPSTASKTPKRRPKR